MNGLIPSVISLPGPPPLVTHLCADELDRYFEAERILSNARREAHALETEAHNILDDARQDASHIRESAHRDGLASGEAALEQRRAAIIDEAVQWLIDAQALEANIADRIDSRISALVASVISSYLGEQDCVELLTHRIKAAIRKESIAHTIRLRVSPTNVASIEHQLSAEHRLCVVPDALLSEHEAKLETPEAIVCLDLERDLNLLLSRLTVSSPRLQP
jgi:flagellar biosynthesis/type III secretory pathway protein FliH